MRLWTIFPSEPGWKRTRPLQFFTTESRRHGKNLAPESWIIPLGSSANISALLFGAEQVAGLAEDDRQFEFQHVPNDTMIDFGIAVDENVPEGNDPLVVADLRGPCWIVSGKLGKRLSDDFQLPLHRRAQHGVRAVIGEALACDKTQGQFGCTCNVVKILLRLNRHRRASWWIRRPGGNMGFE